MADLRELYQEVILDHNKSPRNFKKLENANRSAEGFNPLCGDHYHVYLHIEDNIIQDVSFEGAGCAISKAAASMMTAILKGKSVEQAGELFDSYRRMVTTGEAVSAQELSRLLVFSEVGKYPARIKCAILPWHTMHAALEGKQEAVTTE